MNVPSKPSFLLLISGTDVTDNQEVAIKLECVNAKHPQLMIEAKIYRILQGGCKSSVNKTLTI